MSNTPFPGVSHTVPCNGTGRLKIPRNGSGVYSAPAGTAAVSGDPISSTKFNTLVDDQVDDANAPRPVVAGGTGASSASVARTNLGLGDAATATVQTAADDTTSGRLLTPGAFGWGETSSAIEDADIDDIAHPSGAYRYGAGTSGTLPPGSGSEGYVLRMQRQSNGAGQVIISGDNSAVFHRTAESGAWGAWRRLDMPAGAVQAFAMTTVPNDWLECDGSDVSRTTYAGLFAAIGTTFGTGDGSTTFGLPDLRGEFVRGWDNGKGTDSGRTLGSAQGDAFEAHTHNVNITIGTTDTVRVSGTTDGGSGSSGYATTAQSTGGSETRPRNIALMYCIKV